MFQVLAGKDKTVLGKVFLFQGRGINTDANVINNCYTTAMLLLLLLLLCYYYVTYIIYICHSINYVTFCV